MAYNSKAIREIKKTYLPVRSKIVSRLKKFEKVFKNGTEEEVFQELVFCLLTPQSKARSCWLSVNELLSKNKLYKASARDMATDLRKVRFRNNKSRYIVEARDRFFNGSKVTIKPFIRLFKSSKEARLLLE